MIVAKTACQDMSNIWFEKKKENIHSSNDDFHLPFSLFCGLGGLDWLGLDRNIFTRSHHLHKVYQQCTNIFLQEETYLLSGVEGEGRAAALLGGLGYRLNAQCAYL
jgi:hypothetical protein